MTDMQCKALIASGRLHALGYTMFDGTMVPSGIPAVILMLHPNHSEAGGVVVTRNCNDPP